MNRRELFEAAVGVAGCAVLPAVPDPYTEYNEYSVVRPTTMQLAFSWWPSNKWWLDGDEIKCMGVLGTAHYIDLVNGDRVWVTEAFSKTTREIMARMSRYACSVHSDA